MLKNKNIFLRALEPTDISTIYLWENDSRLWKSSSTTAPFTRKQIWDYIQNYSADIYSQRQLRLMICLHDTTPVGLVDLFDFDPRHKRAFVGLLIDKLPESRNSRTNNAINDEIRRRNSRHPPVGRHYLSRQPALCQTFPPIRFP